MGDCLWGGNLLFAELKAKENVKVTQYFNPQLLSLLYPLKIVRHLSFMIKL